MTYPTSKRKNAGAKNAWRGRAGKGTFRGAVQTVIQEESAWPTTEPGWNCRPEELVLLWTLFGQPGNTTPYWLALVREPLKRLPSPAALTRDFRRDYVTPYDVKAMAYPVFAISIDLRPEFELEGLTVTEVIQNTRQNRGKPR
jgi:hypothetical protein